VGVKPQIGSVPGRGAVRAQDVSFGRFRLDRCAEKLWRDDSVAVELRRKAWTVLCCLVDRPGALVTTEELLDVAWPSTAITPQTLTNVIRELRRALDDDARHPRWIETVYGRGYRFAPGPRSCPPRDGDRPSIELAFADPGVGSEPFVGREEPYDCLHAAFDAACRGDRRVVVIRGEAGIGKTTLVETFLRDLAGTTAVRVLGGRCVDQHGPMEPYMPVLAALADCAAGPDRVPVVASLERYAPTWLLQLPELLDATRHDRLERLLRGTSASRMLREGASLLEALARDRPLVVFLDDLHWADLATVDFLKLLAQRPEPARMLIVVTYRPADAIARDHPIHATAATICARTAAQALDLEAFDETDIVAYLVAYSRERLAEARSDEELTALARTVERHSAGNPLFVRAVVEGMITSHVPGSSRAIELPRDLRDFVLSTLESQPARVVEILEAASVLGETFLVRQVSCMLELEAELVERDLEAVVRVGRLLRVSSACDGSDTTDSSFEFMHGAYRRIVYEHVGPARRRRLHRRAAEVIEAENTGRLASVAAVLAGHFEKAESREKTLDYLEMAAIGAERRFAYREGELLLERALALAAAAPVGSDSTARSAQLAQQLGALRVLLHGYSAPEVADAFELSARLCNELDDSLALFSARMGLTVYHLTRACYEQGEEQAGLLLDAARLKFPSLAPAALCYAAYALSGEGRLAAALQLLDEATALDAAPGVPYYFDIRRTIRSQRSVVLAELGRLDEADREATAALAAARADGRPGELAHAAMQTAESAVLRRDVGGIEAAHMAIAVCEENGFPSFLLLARCFLAALERRAGLDAARAVDEMQQALAARRRLGDRWHESMVLALIAEAEIERGRTRAAAAWLAEARTFVDRSGERHYEPEIIRLGGECALRDDDAGCDRAIAAFARAIALGQTQGAVLWVLRASTSLARALDARGRRDEAREALGGALASFAGRGRHADLDEAHELGEHLGLDGAADRAPTPSASDT